MQGNLSEFVKRVPEAQAYYNLEAASTKFAFPEPGFLEGIKTKDKAILKMARVGFTYALIPSFGCCLLCMIRQCSAKLCHAAHLKRSFVCFAHTVCLLLCNTTTC